jgi:FkbM family methyltransferase
LPLATKISKALRLLPSRRFVAAAIRHRVAAAVEHLEAIAQTKPTTVIDVGANKGQFSLAARAVMPDARIIAFEPLSDAADVYQRLFGDDRRVEIHRVAIAAQGSQAEFHVTNRADSSSLLAPGQGQHDAFGVDREKTISVPVARLDEVIDQASLQRPIMLKIDVQGAELQVLESCRTLDQIDFIYVELSFIELYEGQPLALDVALHLAREGFELAGVFNQIATATFGPTQADFLFRRGR